MAVPPQERKLSDALRRGLYNFWEAASLSLSQRIKVQVAGVELDITGSTTGADMDRMIKEIMCTTRIAPSEREVVHEAKQAVMVPPFQFNNLNNTIVPAKGPPLILPHRLANPLKAMLNPDPLNPKSCCYSLSYFDVATKYKAGWIDDYHGSVEQKDKETRLELAREAIMKNPRPACHEFSRQLSKELKQYGVDPKQIFSCDRARKCYRLGPGWHGTKRLLNTSEAGLLFMDDPEGNVRLGYQEEADE
jgi:hypothetical protein